MQALDDSLIDQLRQRLDERAAALREEIRSLESERADGASAGAPREVTDAGEQGEQRIRDAVRVAEAGRDHDELRQVDAALERIGRGRYGECVDCGEDIAPTRLSAQPWAARCIGCQERWEQAHPASVRIPSLP